MKETELYGPVREYLESEGFEVRGEVAGADIAAFRGDELLLVELKKNLNMKLLIQAAKNQRLTDKVYVAVPRPSFKKRFGRDFKDKQFLLKRLGLGLIVVAMDVEKPYAQLIQEPREFNMARSRAASARKTAHVTREFSGRSGDFNSGGSVRTKLVTAYREDALLIASVLDKEGEMSTAELRASGCAKRAATILYNNHYGWFEKTGRARYRLSGKGKKALVKYSAVLERMVKEDD